VRRSRGPCPARRHCGDMKVFSSKIRMVTRCCFRNPARRAGTHLESIEIVVSASVFVLASDGDAHGGELSSILLRAKRSRFQSSHRSTPTVQHRHMTQKVAGHPGTRISATRRMRRRCASRPNRNTSPDATTPSNVRSKNVDSSTSSRTTGMFGKLRRNASVSVGDASMV
jgi:hypothetical protein